MLPSPTELISANPLSVMYPFKGSLSDEHTIQHLAEQRVSVDFRSPGSLNCTVSFDTNLSVAPSTSMSCTTVVELPENVVRPPFAALVSLVVLAAYESKTRPGI